MNVALLVGDGILPYGVKIPSPSGDLARNSTTFSTNLRQSRISSVDNSQLDKGVQMVLGMRSVIKNREAFPLQYVCIGASWAPQSV
jgi:hypothetical protein